MVIVMNGLWVQVYCFTSVLKSWVVSIPLNPSFFFSKEAIIMFAKISLVRIGDFFDYMKSFSVPYPRLVITTHSMVEKR